jgi:hypothetical protein
MDEEGADGVALSAAEEELESAERVESVPDMVAAGN